MVEGYVYILDSPLMDGIVKIGKTTKSSESRAAEISRGTGVPASPHSLERQKREFVKSSWIFSSVKEATQ